MNLSIYNALAGGVRRRKVGERGKEEGGEAAWGYEGRRWVVRGRRVMDG